MVKFCGVLAARNSEAYTVREATELPLALLRTSRYAALPDELRVSAGQGSGRTGRQDIDRPGHDYRRSGGS